MSRPARALAAGPHVVLRRPTARDRAQFLACVRASRRLHRGWVAPPRTAAAYDTWLRRYRTERHAGFLACRRKDGRMVGMINLNEIVRGSFQGAYRGYYAFVPFVRRGYMTEALGLLSDYAFAVLRLHRLEANIQPANRRSITLVRRCGFRCEGFSPRYLKIAGRWRDHQRWALIAEEWRRAAGPTGEPDPRRDPDARSPRRRAASTAPRASPLSASRRSSPRW